MKRLLNNHSHTYFFIFILLIATIMRLWQFDSFSYSNDELSAISRLEYENFSELIEFGVKKNDFHPAGIQIFLFYWTKIFGTSETAVRLPFVIAGVLAVVFIYLIAKIWFGRNTALFTAGVIATLSFPILYSQIARPYSPGLFFCMAGVYFWSKLIFENKWKNYKILTGYILFSALAAYTHHFSFLFMIIVGATGLLLVKKENLKLYLLAAFAVFLLYLPHLPIFLYQFGIGGVGGEDGWLSTPDEEWFWDYMYYIFNNSFFLIYFTSFIILFSIIYRIIKKNIFINKFHIISIVWFLVLFFIGYYYSIYRNPVLQNSILIFSFPFLFIFLFSFILENNRKYIFLGLFIYISSIAYSTVYEKDFYNTQHFGEFKDITETVDKWHNMYGSDNINLAIRTVDRKYLDFYFKKNNKQYEFAKYKAFTRDDFLEIKEIVEKSPTTYFIYGWTMMGAYIPEDIIRTHYPCIVEEKKYNGLSYIALYSKNISKNCIEEKPDIVFSTDFDNEITWNYPQNLIVDTLGIKAVDLPAIEFGPTFQKQIKEINNGENEKVRISFSVYSKDSGDAQMVLSYDNEKIPGYQWISSNIDYFQKDNQWFNVINTFKLPEYESKEDIIKIYLWNVNKADILIGDIKIEFYENEY